MRAFPQSHCDVIHVSRGLLHLALLPHVMCTSHKWCNGIQTDIIVILFVFTLHDSHIK